MIVMRILVTGGAGFIGSHYVRQVAAKVYPAFAQARLVVLDRLSYAGSWDNLSDATDTGDVEVVHGDVADPSAVERAMSGVDVVIHFAAESHVDRSITGGEEFVHTNVLGTQIVLEAARRHDVQRLVQISTDEVYGSIKQGSWDEREPLAPSSPYSASKASADLLALAYYRTYGLPVCITRCSNNYGPNQFPEKMIPLFVTNLLDGLPIPLYGDGENVRDWLHVDDHCRGIQLVAESGRDGEVYHIGGGAELTNRQVVERLLSATGRDWSWVQRVPDRPGHDRRYSLDYTKTARELGYQPRVDFETGLAGTVHWYRKHRQWWELRKGPQRQQGVDLPPR